ncbi:MAG: Tex family protein [Candidatus Faecousia sp.]|uniref:Tex family protein n=1 Tax=Faecousia sp. TaxID=2952921 RepID=UPI002A87E7E3|nr:Tex family protein [Candidatus Faecousia sp.]
MEELIQQLSAELNCPASYVQNVVTLIDEGNTIPFIARYRKELHGGMDDTALRTLADRLTYLRNLAQRRDEITRSIAAQEKLTDELSSAIQAAKTLAELEDLYRPYKPKRRTRATIAREKGLQPLAELLFAQGRDLPEPEVLAAEYVDPEKGVNDVAAALAGASDIVAETISDDAAIRKTLRQFMRRQSAASSTVVEGKEEEGAVYRLYFDFRQPVSKLQGHQILALNRGEREGFLKVSLDTDREKALIAVRRAVLLPGSRANAFVRAAAEDAYDRLIAPSMERELRSALTDEANEGAIANFALNLRPLLMQPPVKGHVTMGLDPGYAHGCKVAVVDPTGKVLDTAVVYPTFTNRREEAIRRLVALIRKHHVEHLAIGNGTASRETEQVVCELLPQVPGVSYMIVSEAGASVYSASPLAAEEFPQYDVNLRSAVSIARRMQDPLAELVKIDPKAIGVGQYQHDLPEKRLDETLSGVVEDCVNAVGVDLNTASASLLRRVAGLNATTAKNIVAYREENGIFTARKQVLKVPKLGRKAYEQAAGFLRVPESKQLLDHTGVHPESYAAAETLLTLCGYTTAEAASGKLDGLSGRLERYGVQKAAETCGVGVPTLLDIAKELQKPGRDPRDELPAPILRRDVLELKDLKPGMVLTGTVRNVIDFGVFVDIGVHQDGLVHISQVCNRFIKHPSEVVRVGDVVRVGVLEVDEKRKRISLTMRDLPEA